MATIMKQINIKTNIYTIILIFFSILIIGQTVYCATESRENSVVRSVRKVSPAVVNISSQYEIRKNSSPFSGYGMDPRIESFFNDFFSPELQRKEKRTSLGSGVIIDGSHGFVLTNTHVVEKATTITVTFKDQQEFEATIVGMDPDSDLAVLKIKTNKKLPAIDMGNSDDIMIGESVIAIGNPFGFSHTVTTGVVSSVDRSIKTADRVFHKFIQTDASINPGNSGGPLLNINGELIGINTAIYSQAQGIGFAIPINRAKRIITDLITYGTVIKPWIGITVQPLDSSLTTYFKIKNEGVIIKSIEMDSPAEKANLKEGDIILSINSKTLTGIHDYQTILNDISTGQKITLEINRKGNILKISLKTSIFPTELALDLAKNRMGIWVTEVNTTTRYKYGLKANSGVLIEKLRRNSYLAKIGVNPGDIIHQIDEVKIKTLSDFKSAIVKYRDKPSLVLLIQRGAYLYYINAIIKDNEWKEQK